MAGFAGQAVLQHADGVNWVLLEPLTYVDRDGVEWVVPDGARTDLASVPRPLGWLMPRTGSSVSPAVLHDHLWRELVPAGELDYRHADRLLLEALRTVDTPTVLSRLTWAGVRWGALTRPGGRRGWWRDAPAVLAVSIPALALVAAPAVAATLALAVLAAAEAAAWAVHRLLGRRPPAPKVTART